MSRPEYPAIRISDPVLRRRMYVEAFARVIADAAPDMSALAALRAAGFPDIDILAYWRIV